MKRIFVIDNYDSFTFNLVHILREIVEENQITVVRNDEFEIQSIEDYSHILLSPGPGVPSNAGLMPQVIEKYAPNKNILGVCLGHQAIGEVFHSHLYNLRTVFHGIVTPVIIQKKDVLFQNIPDKFNVCRYHSWVIDNHQLGDDLEVIAIAENNNIMAIRHKKYRVRGVQFHPESVVTEHGKLLISNWLNS